MAESFLNKDRTGELWAAIKTALAGKVDLSELKSEYPTTEAMGTAIATALLGYAKSDAVSQEITEKIGQALAEYITKTQMDQAIQEAIVEATGMTVSVEDKLPDTGVEKVIYLVPSATSTEKNVKDEYLWVDGRWELVGSTAVDLTGYWSKEDLTAMTSEELQEIIGE